MIGQMRRLNWTNPHPALMVSKKLKNFWPFFWSGLLTHPLQFNLCGLEEPYGRDFTVRRDVAPIYMIKGSS